MPLNRLTDSGQPIAPPPDVQRTTFGLDVLGRFVCNTWDEATAAGTRPFDAVVIGAGMFGGYCADKIFRDGQNSGLKVLVLDAGPFVLATHLQNLPRLALNVPGPLLPANDAGVARELVWGMPWRSNVEWIGQAYCVGGKSLYWGGWCPRLLPNDLGNWPPSVALYLNTTYPVLENQTGVATTTEFIQGPLFDRLKQQVSAIVAANAVPNLDSFNDAPLAVEGRSPASGLFAFDKYSSVTLIVDAVREAAGRADAQRRLFVLPNAHVTRLRTTGDTVSSVEVSINGTARSLPIRPKCAVILALGTIESTRLSLASFPRSPSDPNLELMGRNVTGHIRTNTYLRIRRSALDPNDTLPKKLQSAALLVRGSTPQGNFHLQVTASADVGGNSDALLYSMIPDIDQLDAILANQDSEWISLAIRGVSQLGGDTNSSVPNPDGRWINLSPWETDEFGVPRAYVQMSSTAAENALADAMDAATLKLASELANNNNADLTIDGPFRDGLGTTYHEAGTLWMGTDPNASVTDSNGRFHHIANAFCADQSLFVTVGSVNPTLTGLVLSRKVAEAVVALATNQPPPP